MERKTKNEILFSAFKRNNSCAIQFIAYGSLCELKRRQDSDEKYVKKERQFQKKTPKKKKELRFEYIDFDWKSRGKLCSKNKENGINMKMASTALKSILCGCIVLVFGIVDDFSAMARSMADDDKSVALLQQHLCRDECSKKVCNHHYYIDSHMFCLFFSIFFRNIYVLHS